MVPSMANSSYFRDPFWDPEKGVSKFAYEADANFRHRFEAFSWTNKQTDIKQTRTSYLETGVAD